LALNTPATAERDNELLSVVLRTGGLRCCEKLLTENRPMATVPHRSALVKVPELAELLAAARGLLPMIADAIPSYRNKADLPVEIVAAMKRAGLHRPYMPKRYGGYEMDWGAHYAISREIAKACGSAGWMASLVFSHIMFVGRFPREAQDQFFAASPDGILSTASAGRGALKFVSGGARLTGRWGFASGVKHSGGQMVIATQGDAQLFTHFCLLLPGEYTIEETWDSEGLRATGSHHVRIDDQFVPEERLLERDVFLSQSPPGAKVNSGYIYRVRPAPYQKSWFMGPLIGTATGALESCVAQTRSRRGQIFGESIADQVPVQVNLGTAVAEIDTAALVFERYIAQLHEHGFKGIDLLGEDLLWGKRNVTFASRLCLSAVDRLSAALGATGQSASNPVQRHFRDCRTVTTHVELNWDHGLAPTGKHRLGIATGDPLVDGGELKAGAESVMLGTQV
jgi:3-hydroxy-9,10-secoandrosta-1,3,5(10)-triene-9,17-dione monooxygenase